MKKTHEPNDPIEPIECLVLIVDERDAEALLRTEENCWGEGLLGPPARYLCEIREAFPDLAAKYSHLPWAQYEKLRDDYEEKEMR